MNVPAYVIHARSTPTHTVWPSGHRPEPPGGPPPPSDPARDEHRDEDHATDEPGYGHGV